MSLYLQTVTVTSEQLPFPDCYVCVYIRTCLDISRLHLLVWTYYDSRQMSLFLRSLFFRSIGPCARCGVVTQTGSCSTPPTSVNLSSHPSRLSPETTRAKAYVPPHLRQRLSQGTLSPSLPPSTSLHARWYVHVTLLSLLCGGTELTPIAN